MTIQPLVHALHLLDEYHREMIDVASQKKQAIIENDVEQLVQIMNQESRILKRIEQAEAQRIELCRQFLKAKGIKSELNLTITELIRLVFDPEEKSQIQQVQNQLSASLAEIKELNQLNQQLIQQSLHFLEFSMELYGGRQDQEATYHHPSDKSAGVQRSGLFDTRA
ncbi:flagellar export chaperone FlgN [Paenibacillus sanguinis]|uniref:flagellar export chaperone FlgN n=1 Tax=Paenibacillus sanguinis TaxID=225906 RepID=UPI00035F43FD|nr:flagellar export chaperone FlgN [Paenibacillus sanguinis]